MSWIDAAGNFWLFGGFGYDSTGTLGDLNDLWKYSTGGEWTWMSGSNVANQPSSYGTPGTAAPSNVPGGRQGSVSWIDSAGNFWLFGGTPQAGGDFGDLWKYGAGEWTWMSGSNIVPQYGVYGMLGAPAPNNVPGGRKLSVSWIDASGNLWLFGGSGYPSAGGADSLNDLWKYQP